MLNWRDTYLVLKKNGGMGWEKHTFFFWLEIFFKTISTRDVKKTCELAYLTYLR